MGGQAPNTLFTEGLTTKDVLDALGQGDPTIGVFFGVQAGTYFARAGGNVVTFPQTGGVSFPFEPTGVTTGFSTTTFYSMAGVPNGFATQSDAGVNGGISGITLISTAPGSVRGGSVTFGSSGIITGNPIPFATVSVSAFDLSLQAGIAL